MTAWKFYDDNSERLFNDYVSLKFKDIFSDIEQFICNSSGCALDVGAGSGRDSAALSDLGFDVTAVEPSKKMRELAASFYRKNKIKWIDDSLPFLKKIISSKKKFDLILISAVWMHLTSQEQVESLSSLMKLLQPKGNIIITLRLGPKEPDRHIQEINISELLTNALKLGFIIAYVSEIRDDSFNRPHIKWQKVVLTTPIK